MKFTKMQGAGNDYVYVNAFVEKVADPANLAIKIADRHFGVGGDGLVLIMPSGPSAKADVRMRMFNADGSESEMCGNAIRCVAKYAHDHGISRANPMKIQTGRGVLTLQLMLGPDGKVSQATVDMSAPILDLAKIPVEAGEVAKTADHVYRVSVTGRDDAVECTFVSMGNPHAVIFVPDVHGVDVARLGPILEHNPAFLRRMNIHWVQIHSRGEVTMRTWERGSGITLACGTGASAVCVASALTGRTDAKILAHLPGGDLKLEWDRAKNTVFMTGPAVEVFSGDWPA